MEEFKPGDMVRLKSGGPKMTVSSIQNLKDGKKMYLCIYFLDSLLREVTLYPEVLDREK